MARCSASYGLGFACFALAVAMASANQFIVGGAHGWSVPPAGAESLNAWAMKNRFQIGDKLLFVYPSDQDSVLLVEPSEYNACNTSSYDKKFTDGNTVITLDRSGAFFFISGVDANCRANEKLIVMVLDAGRNGTAPAPSTTPPSLSPPAARTAPPPSSTSAPPPASRSPPPPASPAPTTSLPPPPPAPAPMTPANTPPPASQSPPATPPSTPPSAPASAPPPPASASSPAPGTHRNNGTTTGTKPPSAGNNNNHQRNGAGVAVSAGLVSSAGACIVGFAMLAL